MVIDQSRITKANVDNLFKAGKITQAQVDTFNKPIVNPNTVVTPTPSTVVQQPVLDNTNPQYNSLIEKGYTPEQISNAWKGIQEKQAKVAPVAPKIEPSKVEVKKEVTTPAATATTTMKGQPDYQDTSAARQTEILGNLEGFFAANPNSFNNEAEFKKTYSVGTGDRNVKQDQWIMNWYNGKKDAIATNSANQVKLNSLTNLNDASLANISSADAVFLMNNDPTAYLRYQKAKTDKDNLAVINSQTPEPEQDPYSLDSIMKSFGIDMGTAEAISSETAEPRKELDTAKTEYDTAKRAYDDILKQTQEQYQGETSSFVNAMAAKKQRELLPDLQTKLDNYNTKVASYNNVLEERKIAAAEKSQKLADFSNAFSIYKANYDMTNPAAEKTQTEVSPLGGIYEKQSDGTRKEITGISEIGQDTGDTSSNTSGNGIFTDADLGRPVGSKNIGADTNNFGNFVNGTGAGNIGTYKSKNGRTYSVFATAQDGYNALINDLKAKQSGGSSKISPNDTFEDLLGVRVNGKKGSIDKNSDYYKAATAVVSGSSKISGVDVNKLAEGIMKGEGTWNSYKSGGKDFSKLKGTQTNNTNTNIPTTDAGTPYITVNGKQVSTESIKNQFTKDPLSVFTAKQITQFEQYTKTADYKKLGTSVKEINENLRAYQVYKELGTTSPEELSQIYIALSVLPVQLRNNEKELEMATQMIKSNLASGMSAYDAADIFRGFDAKAIEKAQGKDMVALGLHLRYVMNQMDEASQPNVGQLSRMLIDGKGALAVKTIENAILASKVTEDGVNAEKEAIAFNKTQKELETLGGGGGVFGGIARARLGITTEKRNTFIDTINTYNTKFGLGLEPLGLRATTNQLQSRLSVISKRALESVNGQRQSVGLPILTRNQLLDQEKRKRVYIDMLGGNNTPPVGNILSNMYSIVGFTGQNK